ncbi:MAG: STAS domain-containing protein [Pseudodesulfovibrio sp.]
MNRVQDMQVVRGCLIAPVPGELGDGALAHFKDSVLARVSVDSIRRVLIDVSARHILDSTGLTHLTECARMTTLLGAQVIFVGFQPGVVSALIDLGSDVDDMICAGTVEDGFVLFRSMEPAQEQEEAPDEEDTDENVDEAHA